MKIYLIAGEASGDLHGSQLIQYFKILDPKIAIRCFGGCLMEKAGAVLVKHYKDTAFIGFDKVLLNIKTILKAIKLCKRDIIQFNPDAIIFIDYPGFNLKICKWAKLKGFKTHYYIAPKVWVWKEKRIELIRKYVDHLYTIFPFETEFFTKKHNIPTNYVGNPSAQIIKNYKPNPILLEYKKPIIALLPGSRIQEITYILPVFKSIVHYFTDYQFVIVGTSDFKEFEYKKFLGDTHIPIIFNQAYDILAISVAALVASGTATLETALFKVPQVVGYKINKFNYWLATKIFNLRNKIKFISLVNIILNKQAVKELIQEDLSTQNLLIELKKNLENPQKIFEDYQTLRDSLLEGGGAFEVANKVITSIK